MVRRPLLLISSCGIISAFTVLSEWGIFANQHLQMQSAMIAMLLLHVSLGKRSGLWATL